MAYPELLLKPGREHQIREGHPWIFGGAVARHPGAAEAGGIVDVLDDSGKFVARGTFNPRSSIPVRVLTRDQHRKIDKGLLTRRVEQACNLRRRWIDGKVTNAYRLVNGESDHLPGLIVDRYTDFLVVQFHTLGMDRLRDLLVEVLQAVVGPTGIYERSDVGTRRAEGLTTRPVGLLAGKEPPELIEIREERARFWVDVRRGQKTGFFLDQRENRLAARSFTKGLEVLNCFSYTGAFTVHAALAKASRVVSVDVSEPAAELAVKNLELNRLSSEDHPVVVDNTFDFLKQCHSTDTRFDVLIVDPPAFVKTREALTRAVQAYISLNRKAIGVLRPGGVLITASCSTQVDYDCFFSIVKHAAAAEGREIQIVKTHLQAVDHPVSVSFPEGQYLKCLIGIVN